MAIVTGTWTGITNATTAAVTNTTFTAVQYVGGQQAAQLQQLLGNGFGNIGQALEQQAQAQELYRQGMAAIMQQSPRRAQLPDSAYERASKLLNAHLSPSQRLMWKTLGRFAVRGQSGREYVIRGYGSFNISGRVPVSKANCNCCLYYVPGAELDSVRICCSPNPLLVTGDSYYYLPGDDMVLGQKLALELDEEAFLRNANFSLQGIWS